MPVLANLIGGNHQISEDNWALSLIRKTDADHAYLILEGVDDNGVRLCMDTHLVIKEGSNNKKADIIYRALLPWQVQAVGANCSSYTWSISRHQAAALINLVQSEQQRAHEDKINYVKWGQSKLNNLVGSGLQSSGSNNLQMGSEHHSGYNASSDMLLREGHNCGSWAIAMVKALQLKFTSSWSMFVYVRPKELIQGTHDADLPEPTTADGYGCRIM